MTNQGLYNQMISTRDLLTHTAVKYENEAISIDEVIRNLKRIETEAKVVAAHFEVEKRKKSEEEDMPMVPY